MHRLKLAAVFLGAGLLSGCSHDYPLVANGYAKTADISALDDEGRGNFALPVPPKSCLLAFRKMPDLKTMQIRAVVENGTDKTFTSAILAQALNGQDFKTGVFVVDETGVSFQKGYDCDSEIK